MLESGPLILTGVGESDPVTSLANAEKRDDGY